jgi:hypothetical protein
MEAHGIMVPGAVAQWNDRDSDQPAHPNRPKFKSQSSE